MFKKPAFATKPMGLIAKQQLKKQQGIDKKPEAILAPKASRVTDDLDELENL